MEKNKSKTYVAGTLALGTIIVAGGYYLYRKLTKVHLNSWLEEYIKEVTEELQQNKVNPIPLKLAAKILNLFSETQDYLYMCSHSDLESERIEAINSRRDYEELVSDTIEHRERYFLKAQKIIEARLNVSIEEVQKIITESDKLLVREIFATAKKPYRISDLPQVEKETAKNAYIYYVKMLINNYRINREQVMLMNRNPEMKDRIMMIYITNEYILKDNLKKQYKIEEKYLNQILTLHNLDNDEEIVNWREESRRLE